jgi:hypothetical protein
VPAHLHDGPRGFRAQTGDSQQELERRPRDLQGKSIGVGERPRGLGIVLERQVPADLERQLLDTEAVFAKQVLGLVEA